MSLATRCPACGTVFRVVADQLKVSDGWVRCGRCGEVFDARAALIDLEAPGAAIVAPPPGGAAPIAAAAQAANDEASPIPAPAPVAERTIAPPATPQTSAPPQAPISGAAVEPSGVDLGPAGDASSAAATAGPAQPPPEAAADLAADPAADPAEDPAADSATDAEAAPPVPGFVRRADRARRRRSPLRRTALAVAALGLAVLLGAQVALHERDLVAAAWPDTAPWLQAACRQLGCRVDAPRRIDALSVESSALLRVDGTRLHRLQIVVRNRATTDVRLPAIDLTLTDTTGRTVARRVFDAHELGVAADRLRPQAEATMSATLDLSSLAVAGYAVELFYP